MCHALHDPTGLQDEDYLEEQAQQEAKRDVLHLKVIYSSGRQGELYVLRGECTHNEQKAIRERLRPHESVWGPGWRMRPPIGAVPVGRFPSHTTGVGEGYEWPHIHEYAQYAMQSAQHAWYSKSLASFVLGDTPVFYSGANNAETVTVHEGVESYIIGHGAHSNRTQTGPSIDPIGQKDGTEVESHSHADEPRSPPFNYKGHTEEYLLTQLSKKETVATIVTI